MGERMKKIFILGLLLTVATAARADIPTMQYLYEFYERECGIPKEMGLSDMIEEFLQEATGQTIPKSAIATQWMSLTFVDNFNGNTTYAQDLTTNNVVSVGFLKSTLDLINNTMCCKDGILDTSFGECITAFDGMCEPMAYVSDSVSCPAGWERVELSHASLAVGRYYDSEYDSSSYCPVGTLPYSGNYLEPEYLGRCALTLGAGAQTTVSVDVCLPPVDGEITIMHGDWSDLFVIGDGCVAADYDVTCDTTYVKGEAYCNSYWLSCKCAKTAIMTASGVAAESKNHSYTLKKFDTLEDCEANCAYDCARAIQTMPGFRHVVLIEPLGECGT